MASSGVYMLSLTRKRMSSIVQLCPAQLPVKKLYPAHAKDVQYTVKTGYITKAMISLHHGQDELLCVPFTKTESDFSSRMVSTRRSHSK